MIPYWQEQLSQANRFQAYIAIRVRHELTAAPSPVSHIIAVCGC